MYTYKSGVLSFACLTEVHTCWWHNIVLLKLVPLFFWRGKFLIFKTILLGKMIGQNCIIRKLNCYDGSITIMLLCSNFQCLNCCNCKQVHARKSNASSLLLSKVLVVSLWLWVNFTSDNSKCRQGEVFSSNNIRRRLRSTYLQSPGGWVRSLCWGSEGGMHGHTGCTTRPRISSTGYCCGSTDVCGTRLKNNPWYSVCHWVLHAPRGHVHILMTVSYPSKT